MGKNLKLNKVHKKGKKDKKDMKERREKGKDKEVDKLGVKRKANVIRKLKPKKELKEKKESLMAQLNVNVDEAIREQLTKLSLKAERIEEEQKKQQAAQLTAFLSRYGKDHDKKLIENVQQTVSQQPVMSRGQRKRFKRKAMVAKKKLLAHHALAVHKPHIQVNLKTLSEIKLPEATPPSAGADAGKGKDTDEKMMLGVQKKGIRKDKRKKKSKQMKLAAKQYVLWSNDRAQDVELFKKVLTIPQFAANPIATMKEHVANTLLIEEKKDKIKVRSSSTLALRLVDPANIVFVVYWIHNHRRYLHARL